MFLIDFVFINEIFECYGNAKIGLFYVLPKSVLLFFSSGAIIYLMTPEVWNYFMMAYSPNAFLMLIAISGKALISTIPLSG